MPQARPTEDLGFARRRVPAWLMSGVLHFTVFLTLSFLLRFTPRGDTLEPNRAGGIVLVKNSQGKTQYLSEGGPEGSVTSHASASTESGSSPLPSAADVPVNLAGMLPSRSEGAGLGGTAGDALPSAGALTAGGGTGKGIGGQVQTGVFGVQGTGRKFVYVFDRSGSMEGYGGRPLAAAKSELIASLENLQSIHQFQIIFYNDKPQVMNLAGYEGRLAFGDDASKRAAARFVSGIVADGGTQHMEAIKKAVALQPDVIFFLTDADEPQIRPDELAKIRIWNKSEAIINTIEFGAGPPSGSDNFLKKLARQNRGQHVYVDVTRLSDRK